MENKICCSSFMDCDRETENKDHEVKKNILVYLIFHKKLECR